ncbi:MAG TPA: hypothetical protein VM076_02235 [Gemmatimonadaceae bacterium]|nr:hypothetical protein [Gemmatimonadaceae bacterium]
MSASSVQLRAPRGANVCGVRHRKRWKEDIAASFPRGRSVASHE